MALELNANNFDKETNDKLPVLVDFWAPWCGPCRAQAPVLDKLDISAVKICKVNVDENPDLSERYGIMSIPTLLVFRGGKLSGKAVGLQSLPQLKKLIGIQ